MPLDICFAWSEIPNLLFFFIWQTPTHPIRPNLMSPPLWSLLNFPM